MRDARQRGVNRTGSRRPLRRRLKASTAQSYGAFVVGDQPSSASDCGSAGEVNCFKELKRLKSDDA